MSDDDLTPYNNTHRAFLQSFLARSTLTYPDAKPILAAIQTAATPNRPTLAEDISQDDFEAYIDTLNTSISPFDFEIRSALHQATKERIYALVNTTSDALTQMSTIHTADEIAFVKRVLDAMFETYNTQRAEIMAVTGMQAVRLAKAPGSDELRRRDSGTQAQTQGQNANLTMSQAEKVLALMVEEGWFELSRSGFYSLSPRTLMELRSWLVETYNVPPEENEDSDEEDEVEHTKIKFCAACREIVTIGQRCPDLSCNARVHDHCVRNLFRAQGGREQCPTCKKEWVDPPPVGERAARGGQCGGGRRTTNGSSTGGGRRTTNGSGAERRRTMEANGAASEESDAESGAEDEE